MISDNEMHAIDKRLHEGVILKSDVVHLLHEYWGLKHRFEGSEEVKKLYKAKWKKIEEDLPLLAALLEE